MSEWTSHYYQKAYLRRWALGLPNEDQRAEAAEIMQMLGAAPGNALLDVGCGQGRYPLAFASLGVRVVGADRYRILLREGRRLAQGSGAAIGWLCADMRSLPFRSNFDHAVLLDAFGFFDDPHEDEHALAEVGRALRPEGTALVKVVDGDMIRSNFVPDGRSEDTRHIETFRRELTEDGDRLIEDITIEDDHGSLTTRREQRLYSSERLAGTAKSAGLEVLDVRRSGPDLYLVAQASGT